MGAGEAGDVFGEEATDQFDDEKLGDVLAETTVTGPAEDEGFGLVLA